MSLPLLSLLFLPLQEAKRLSMLEPFWSQAGASAPSMAAAAKSGKLLAGALVLLNTPEGGVRPARVLRAFSFPVGGTSNMHFHVELSTTESTWVDNRHVSYMELEQLSREQLAAVLCQGAALLARGMVAPFTRGAVMGTALSLQRQAALKWSILDKVRARGPSGKPHAAVAENAAALVEDVMAQPEDLDLVKAVARLPSACDPSMAAAAAAWDRWHRQPQPGKCPRTHDCQQPLQQPQQQPQQQQPQPQQQQSTCFASVLDAGTQHDQPSKPSMAPGAPQHKSAGASPHQPHLQFLTQPQPGSAAVKLAAQPSGAARAPPQPLVSKPPQPPLPTPCPPQGPALSPAVSPSPMTLGSGGPTPPAALSLSRKRGAATLPSASAATSPCKRRVRFEDAAPEACPHWCAAAGAAAGAGASGHVSHRATCAQTGTAATTHLKGNTQGASPSPWNTPLLPPPPKEVLLSEADFVEYIRAATGPEQRARKVFMLLALRLQAAPGRALCVRELGNFSHELVKWAGGLFSLLRVSGFFNIPPRNREVAAADVVVTLMPSSHIREAMAMAC